MQYMLLIYEDEKVNKAMSPTEGQAMYQAYMQFTQDVVKSGHFKAGDALQPVATAHTVRLRDGETIVSDGPFAETREQLGGYYLVEAKSLDEAVKIAARIPAAKSGSIEIREVVVFDQPQG
jgi:hypothetical protein